MSKKARVRRSGNSDKTANMRGWPDPRMITLDILNLIETASLPLDLLIEEHVDRPRLFAGRDRSFFNILLFGILRWRSRLDWTIGHFSRTPFEKIDPTARNILRLGLFQAAYLDRVPISAAVHTSVEIAKRRLPPHIVRFINAVLRKAAHRHHETPLPDGKNNSCRRIAVEYAFPEWMIRRWMHRYGKNRTERICRAMNRIPEITLRTNRLYASRMALFRELTDTADGIRLTRHSPLGIGISGPKTPIAQLPKFSEGWFQIQDEAAQLVSFLVNPRPGERILDACCGFGGKTGHLAQMMKNRGRLHAVDVEASKQDRLQSEIVRLGIGIVETIAGDLRRNDVVGQLGIYDRILVDAPCSGMGVMRRNPDIKWNRAPTDPQKHQIKQLRLLETLQNRLKVGGTLVYSVCSMENEETEQVIRQFLKKHPDFAIKKSPAVFDVFLKPFSDGDGFFRTFPDMDGMDGFFAARLYRKDR